MTWGVVNRWWDPLKSWDSQWRHLVLLPDDPLVTLDFSWAYICFSWIHWLMIRWSRFGWIGWFVMTFFSDHSWFFPVFEFETVLSWTSIPRITCHLFLWKLGHLGPCGIECVVSNVWDSLTLTKNVPKNTRTMHFFLGGAKKIGSILCSRCGHCCGPLSPKSVVAQRRPRRQDRPCPVLRCRGGVRRPSAPYVVDLNFWRIGAGCWGAMVGGLGGGSATWLNFVQKLLLIENYEIT